MKNSEKMLEKRRKSSSCSTLGIRTISLRRIGPSGLIRKVYHIVIKENCSRWNWNLKCLFPSFSCFTECSPNNYLCRKVWQDSSLEMISARKESITEFRTLQQKRKVALTTSTRFNLVLSCLLSAELMMDES